MKRNYQLAMDLLLGLASFGLFPFIPQGSYGSLLLTSDAYANVNSDGGVTKWVDGSCAVNGL